MRYDFGAMRFHNQTLLLGSALLFVLSAVCPAQWPSSPAVNLPIGDLANDQQVPKLAATPDGGAWIAWFDNSSGNYNVALQKVDANGYEQFAHNGITVSANAQNSSLVDWDLIADSAGNAVLCFTDVRAGGDLDVYAYRITPTGTFLWGANGVALSADGHFEANPVVAELSDGSFAFAWSRSPSGLNARLVMQRLDAAGTPLFGAAGIEVLGGTNNDPGFVGIVPTPGTAYILSWIRDTTPFTAPKHLWTQKFDATGTAVWGAAPVVVYDAASLPIAFKPELMSDGQGGAWHAWHVSVGSFFQGRVQHIDAAGTQVFAHNGVEISLEANRSEFNPSMVMLGNTGDLLVFYNKRDSAQALWGIGGQRVTATGQLAWGTNGIEFIPTDATTEEVPRAVAAPNGACCFVEQGNYNNTIVGFRVDAAGVMSWATATTTVSAQSTPKDKLRAVSSTSGATFLAWADTRLLGWDIYAQNVNLDGTLGIPPALATPYATCVNPANTLVAAAPPSLGTTFIVGVDDPSGSMPVGSLSILAVALLADAAFPCGTVLPNAGMSAAGTNGELAVDLGTLLFPFFTGAPWAGAGNAALFPFPLPNASGLLGMTLNLQGALVDPVSGRFGLTNGLRVRFGP